LNENNEELTKAAKVAKVANNMKCFCLYFADEGSTEMCQIPILIYPALLKKTHEFSLKMVVVEQKVTKLHMQKKLWQSKLQNFIY
jgi:hypothetical protein